MMEIHAVTPEGRRAGAYLDGVDVSNRCVAANDEAGWVDLIALDDKGKFIIDGYHDPVIERYAGAVTIELGKV
jgi:hypothetical protein